MKNLNHPDETRTLSVGEIVRDPALQFRSTHLGTVRQYAATYRSGNAMPPVLVADYNGTLILTDGWHRMEALERNGQGTVDAVVTKVSSEEEIRWLAAKANTTHGRPLKSKEYREVFKAYIKAKQHRMANGDFKSYREVATELGGTRGHTTIMYWMKRDFPSIARAMGGHNEATGYEEDKSTLEERLAEGVIRDLERAQAAMPAVSMPYQGGIIVTLLEDMLQQARSKGWQRWEQPEETMF